MKHDTILSVHRFTSKVLNQEPTRLKPPEQVQIIWLRKKTQKENPEREK
jgi:hypothetical protein